MSRTSSTLTSKKLVLLILGIALGLLGLSRSEIVQIQSIIDTPAPGNYRVIAVNDGDTITVDMNGAEERIRFIGVDTPETQDPRKPVQCFGKAATNFATNLIMNESDSIVRLEADQLSSNRDRYNRLLRYVYLQDGRLAQAEIISQGYGFAYTSFPFTKSDEFKQLENSAREQNLGLWNTCQPTPNDYGGYDSSNATE